MKALAHWFAVLILVFSTSSCASASLYQWASEKTPRSEVLGFVDGRGCGDALIFKVQGEQGISDGLYETPVEHKGNPKIDFEKLAATRLGDTEVEALRSMRNSGANSARLNASALGSTSIGLPIDVYERVDGVLRRIQFTDRSCIVTVCGQVESPGGNAFTRVELRCSSSSKAEIQSGGVAYLPPARVHPVRIVVGVVAAPLAVATDVITIPVQIVVAGVMIDRALSKFFDPFSSAAFQLLVDGGMFETTWFVISFVPAIVDPSIGGMLLLRLREERTLKI